MLAMTISGWTLDGHTDSTAADELTCHCCVLMSAAVHHERSVPADFHAHACLADPMHACTCHCHIHTLPSLFASSSTQCPSQAPVQFERPVSRTAPGVASVPQPTQQDHRQSSHSAFCQLLRQFIHSLALCRAPSWHIPCMHLSFCLTHRTNPPLLLVGTAQPGHLHAGDWRCHPVQ